MARLQQYILAQLADGPGPRPHGERGGLHSGLDVVVVLTTTVVAVFLNYVIATP